MVYEQLVAFYGSPSNAANTLDVDRRLVDCWKRRRIPSIHQFKAHHLSDGALKLDAQAKREARELARFLPSIQRAAA